MSQVTDSLEHLAWLAASAWDAMLHFWPISAAVLAVGVAALIGNPFRDVRFRKAARLFLVAYLAPLLILLLGTVLRYELHGPPHPNWRRPPTSFEFALWLPLALQVVVVITAVVVSKGARLRSAGLLLPGVWVSLCVLVVATFSVVGVGP
jgi:hypothetical protein